MKGFTLIEAAVSLVVVAILALALFAYSASYPRSVLQVNKQLMAANLAREVMEELYWSRDLTTPVDASIPADALGQGSNTTRSYSVTGDSTGNYRIITTTVGWN